jgi:hypothetical protein
MEDLTAERSWRFSGSTGQERLPNAPTTKEVTTAISALSQETFQHELLDLSISSIRLIEILPRSSSGLISCNIIHATTDAKYTCLSYVWGDPPATQSILLNGKILKVRSNLFDFLNMCSTKAAELSAQDLYDWIGRGDTESPASHNKIRLFWIDAISIDQDNVAEKNHQVQQMGSIYSKAQEVVAWLGNDPRMSLFFDDLKAFPERSEETSTQLWEDLQRSHPTKKADPVSPTLPTQNAYWERAWITQEVILAQSLYLCTTEQLINAEKIDTWDPDLFQRDVEGFHSMFLDHRAVLARHGRLPADDEDDKPSHLLESLYDFRTKECLIPRDKVYSLLACSQHGNQIIVDYNAPLPELIRNVFSLPGATRPCLCQIKMVIEQLCVEPWLVDCANVGIADQFFVQLQARAIPPDGLLCPDCPDRDETFQTTRSSRPRKIFACCLCCTHITEAVTRTKNQHGHLVISREDCVVATGGQGPYEWQLFVHTPGQSVRSFQLSGELDEVDTITKDDDNIVAFQISFRVFCNIALMVSGFPGDAFNSDVWRRDEETDWQPNWRFL